MDFLIASVYIPFGLTCGVDIAGVEKVTEAPPVAPSGVSVTAPPGIGVEIKD